MRKVWEVILDLVYEDVFQFFGPILALALVWLIARTTVTAWLGVLLFALISLSLYLSLRREQKGL
jgi:hypothetical protein